MNNFKNKIGFSVGFSNNNIDDKIFLAHCICDQLTSDSCTRSYFSVQGQNGRQTTSARTLRYKNINMYGPGDVLLVSCPASACPKKFIF